MATGFAFGEALVLGLASGPACLASCGPVLVPSLLAERGGVRIHARYLGAFLCTRLIGYLLFAVVAWEVGASISLRGPPRPTIFGVIHVLLGAALLWYAYAAGRACKHSCATSQLVTIGGRDQRGIPAAALLGFLTGVSLCPPFVAAGVRAAQATNVGAAIIFFAVFFLGTSAWFVPFAGMGWVRRNEAVITVARMAMVLIGLYYFLAGFSVLIGKTVFKR